MKKGFKNMTGVCAHVAYPLTASNTRKPRYYTFLNVYGR
jgi:hypothetical protein